MRLTAGLAGPAVQRARNPGYPTNDVNPAVRETVFFGERGAETFRGARFGQATADHYDPQPDPGQNGARAVRLAFGVRF